MHVKMLNVKKSLLVLVTVFGTVIQTVDCQLQPVPVGGDITTVFPETSTINEDVVTVIPAGINERDDDVSVLTVVANETIIVANDTIIVANDTIILTPRTTEENESILPKVAETESVTVYPQPRKDIFTEDFSISTSTLSIQQDHDETEDAFSSLSTDNYPQNTSEDANKVSAETTTENPLSVCSAIGAKQVADAIVKCQCQGDEILVDGKCQEYDGVTLLDVEKEWFYTVEANVSNYEVIVRNVNCDPTLHHYTEFPKGQFHLRERGDMVLLKSAEKLEGQRINNYCLVHHLDSQGDLTWTMRTCLPIPSVPRCCPPGLAMKNGSCQPARTPAFLNPPVAAKPFAESVEWDNITNYFNPLTCQSEPMHTIPLGHKESNLISLADGLAYAWLPGVISKRRVYYNCPNYCMDGIENEDGSVEYYASFCYANPIESHKEACGDKPCIRKCCEYGYSMDMNRYICVPDQNSTFAPPTVTSLANYIVTIGWPLCTPNSKTMQRISIDRSGILILKEKTFESTDYCVDTFLNNDQREDSALACLALIPTWLEVRPILFPICNAISLLFLTITIACHLLVPKLLGKGGVHQLCHAIALVIAYSSSFSVFVFHNFFTRDSCFSIAIIMQFGYLTTFFWLNVMCFEIWRKIRRLKNFRPCKTYPKRYYMLYAWGIPAVICVITIAMQFLAPDNIPFLIKPYIGTSRCWFREDIALLIYFYGPIAFLFVCNTMFLCLTYLNYKMMLRAHKETTKTLKEMGTGINSDKRCKTTSSMPSRQLTDHVHDFKQKLKLFILMATCWVTEVLSWKIPPVEIWALTDTLNSLQGVFIFVILLSNRNKLKELKGNNSKAFKFVRSLTKIPHKLKKLLCHDGTSLSPVNSFASSFASSISKRMTESTLVTSFSKSIKRASNSSFEVSSHSPMVSRSVSLDSAENGIVTLSHTSHRGTRSLKSTPESPC